MIATILKSTLNGEINAIPSKSFGHRIMIAAALSERPTIINGYFNSMDFIATKDCLEVLGAEFEMTSPSQMLIAPINGKPQKNAVLNVFESGSTLRFLLPVTCALGVTAKFECEGRLKERPISHLVETLKSRGVSVTDNVLPLTTDGKLSAGQFKIRGDISSQYITGLLFALPLLDGDSTIEIDGELQSDGYIDITLEVLKIFKIDIKRSATGFTVSGNQQYISPGEITIEGDWSNSAFFIAGAALSGQVTINNLNLSSCQGDKRILDVVNEMGAEVTFGNCQVTVKAGKLKPIDYIVSDIPDLVPVMAVLAAYANGVSKFHGISRLRFKESDRLASIMDMLKKVGIKSEDENDCLVIYGGEFNDAEERELYSYNDHRLVMAQAIMSLNLCGITVIHDSSAIDKSYPNFFDDYNLLGGKANVVDF